MGFGDVGRSIGSAIDQFGAQRDKDRKRKLLQEFVTRQLGRLPPEQAAQMARAQAPMPASTLMDGMSDTGVPPELAGGAMMAPPPQEVDVLGLLEQSGAPPQGGGETDALRMLLEATRDDLAPPESLFEYIAKSGQLGQQASGRADIERMKAELKKEMQDEMLRARMEQILAGNEGKMDVAETYAGAKKEVAATNADAGIKRANIGANARVTSAGIGANARGAGKAPDPTSLGEDELGAEIETYQALSDSLANAGASPDSVGRRDPQKRQFAIDETARQKDLSKRQDRLALLLAEQAKRRAGRKGGQEAPPAQGGKPLTRDVVAEAKRRFGKENKQRAAEWLKSQGYDVR